MLSDLQQLNEHVTRRTLDRLAGLTDAEYLWEPAPGCWSVREAPDGSWRADLAAVRKGDTSPFTTIGWRLWHLTACYTSPRTARWLGAATAPMDVTAPVEEVRPAPDARRAVQQLHAAAAWFAALLGALTVADLAGTLGPVAAPFQDSARLGFVLHLLDEQIHHAAEIALLRDLYAATSGRPA